MTVTLFAGIALALCSTVCSNSGMVVEKLAIRRMPTLHARRTVEMIRTLFRAPLWVFGFVLLVSGLGVQVLALTLAPISIVQTVSACGIVLLLVLSHILLGDRLGRFEYLGMALVLLALVLLGLSIDPHADHAASSGSFGALVLAAIPAVVASFCLFFAAESIHGSSVRRSRLRAPLFGLSSGLLYGVAALGVKEVSTILERDGLVRGVPHVFSSPALYVVLAASVLGFLIFQTALQRCLASILVPVNNLSGSAYFIVVGSAVFHEHLPNATEPLVLRLSAFASIVAALCALGLGKEAGEVHDMHIAVDEPTG
jgi:drug/metabolite transporter (DMT)-like permease